ncbi:MAG: hypothetical protein V1645_01530 [archaeon]
MGARFDKKYLRRMEFEKLLEERGKKHLSEEESEQLYKRGISFPNSLVLLAHLMECEKCYTHFIGIVIEEDLVREGKLPIKKMVPLPPKIKKALKKFKEDKK